MEVKTNKEYTAMLHEIESVEREIRALEDQVLEEMERGENLVAEIKREEGAFTAAEERHRGDVRALEERERALGQTAAERTSERDAIAATLPEAVLELFQRVARLRGSAVAEARDGMCQTCHVKLRLQMFVEVKRNDALMQCPACQRVLYFDASVTAPSPGP